VEHGHRWIGFTRGWKEALYRRIAEGLKERVGVAPGNVFVSLVEVGREDWSFGQGVAQYAVADRAAAGS
jgi:hypothetical protein